MPASPPASILRRALKRRARLREARSQATVCGPWWVGKTGTPPKRLAGGAKTVLALPLPQETSGSPRNLMRAGPAPARVTCPKPVSSAQAAGIGRRMDPDARSFDQRPEGPHRQQLS